MDGLTAEFWLPESMYECKQGVSLYGACNRELFPWDDTETIMLRVLLELRDFAVIEDQKRRVQVMEAWFNQVLYENAIHCDKPPMGFKRMLKLAKDQVHIAGYSDYRPPAGRKTPKPVPTPATGKDARRSGGAGGSGRASGGGGSTSRGPADGSDEEVGKCVRDRRLAKIGSELLCVDFGLGKCTEGDASSGGCRKRGVFLAHRCSVVKDKSKIPLDICGGKHDNRTCKFWVP